MAMEWQTEFDPTFSKDNREALADTLGISLQRLNDVIANDELTWKPEMVSLDSIKLDYEPLVKRGGYRVSSGELTTSLLFDYGGSKNKYKVPKFSRIEILQYANGVGVSTITINCNDVVFNEEVNYNNIEKNIEGGGKKYKKNRRRRTHRRRKSMRRR